MMRPSLALWCVLITLLLLMSGPESVSATKYAGAFMDIGGGARPLGMGGAFVAVANDASTVYYNPAGISGWSNRQALFMHSERFGNLLNYNFGSYVQPTKLLSDKREAGFGFALQHLGADDIVISNHLEYFDANGNGRFEPGEGDYLTQNGQRVPDEVLDNLPRESDNSFAFLGAFGLATGFGRLGGTLKIIYTDSVDGNSSAGIGIDLGYLYRGLLVDHLDVGVKLQDATGTYLSWSTGTTEYIWPMVKVGAAYTIVSEAMRGSLLLAIDSDFYFDNRQFASQYWVGEMSADIHAGAELRFQEKVMVRGGVDSGNWTAGAGLLVKFIGFDYAYLHHDDFESTHRVSLLANF
jgi:hypothetical protein